jgi:hypothetical protein
MRHRRARCASLSVPSSSKAARSSRAATTTTDRTTTAPRCARGGTASPYRCTRRCTPYSASPACLRPSASSRARAPARPRSYKHRAPPNNLYPHHQHHHGSLKARRPSLHARGTRVAFHAPCSLLAKRRAAEEARSGGGSQEERDEGRGSSGREARVSRACTPAPPCEADKAWSARRRDPRINGADIYVARVTKVGMGSAKPCWRCVEWCRWAGVKRIFHWNGEDGKFDMVKVNTAERDQYETHADIRLYAGMVSSSFAFLSCSIDPDTIFPFRAGNMLLISAMAACLAPGHYYVLLS